MRVVDCYLKNYQVTLNFFQVKVIMEVGSAGSVTPQEMTSPGYFIIHGLLALTAPIQTTQKPKPISVSLFSSSLNGS